MSEISANDLVDLVRELENDIKKYLDGVLSEFKATTGFAINGVWVDLSDATTTNSAHPDYVLNKVVCDVALRE